MVDNITAKAYEVISSKQHNQLINSNTGINKNLNHKVVMYVETPEDKQTHKYFHLLQIQLMHVHKLLLLKYSLPFINPPVPQV